MKQTLTLFLALFILTTTFAKTNLVVLPAKPKPSKLNANQILVPIGKKGETVSLMDLSRMKVKDLEAFTGEKMKLPEKIGFAIAQKQLRNNIGSDGAIHNKKLEKALAKAGGTSDFNLGGFALGVLDPMFSDSCGLFLVFKRETA